MKTVLYSAIVAAACLSPAAAFAQAQNGAQTPTLATSGNAWALYYGVDITSNYVSKGVSQTDDDPAVQVYVEAEYASFYAGLWASNVSFGGVNDVEVDVYLGYRTTLGAVDLDVGFAQYFYRDDSADYGEAYVKANFAATDAITLTGEYYREVYVDQNWFYAGADYAGLPFGWAVSGGVGSDLGSRDLAEDAYSVDIGFSRDLSANSAIDLRAYLGNVDEDLYVVTLSFFN